MMKVYALTIRDKKTQELIYAEGVRDNEYISHFSIDAKWITENDKENLTESWCFNNYRQTYSFDEEVRHAMYDTYDLIEFNIEEIEIH